MGSKRNNQVISSTDEIKIVADPNAVSSNTAADEMDSSAEGETTAEAQPAEAVKVKKAARVRSKKYQVVRAKVDKTKKYDAFAAIELVKKLSYTKFDGTITAHLMVKEAGITVSFAPPYSTGKTLRVAIVTDELLADVQAGKIEFDILLASPEFMPKLAKLAPVLGPKGLMPNPKNGTLTKDTAGQKKRLEAGTITVKTEKKAPLMHVQIGKNSMDTKELVGNLEALLKAAGNKMVRAAVAASMSPGVKIETSSYMV